MPETRRLEGNLRTQFEKSVYGRIYMNAVLLIGWVVVIVASYKGAVVLLEKTDHL